MKIGGERKNNGGIMKRIVLIVLGVMLASNVWAASWFNPSDYSGGWNDNPNLEISRVLGSNNIRGCGEYRFMESNKSSKEYLVQCTRDGKKWVSYVVWARLNKVMKTDSK